MPHVTELVAMGSSYPFARFPVPGGEIPVGGLTWVGVHPGHRRRGLLSAMMDHHHTGCAARGEAVSVLTASESTIYGRFGYGKAADSLAVTVPRRAALADVPGAEQHTARIEASDQARHADVVADLHRRAGAAHGGVGRPGWATRESPEQTAWYWASIPAFRHGKEPWRTVIVERDGEPRGYARFRRSLGWGQAGPDGSVEVFEAVALDPAASRALWGLLLDLDLMTEVKVPRLPVDDPLLTLLLDPRAAVPRVEDTLWVRVLDVAAALSGRQYAADVDVVLSVRDTARGAATTDAGEHPAPTPATQHWALVADAFGDATCTPTDRPADLDLDVRELGSVYLGGTSLASLAAAGLVTELTPGSLARASTAFGWPVPPACSWIW
ncbi:UPF0256 protein [Paraoerskovia sediminicola]|uniref:UPF0256 protein n=1 Tax=Paraoerskovia sediminicola TaxID=1138587 RepID=A0ABN6X824_9CELL|nr:GNAT family N-acetyltransferase [Paraoerskovia sediminicola]BDZ40734.1 UPF0256 protein [Paraoerskovia sediminicola]